jgi:hypothetical protein
LLSVSCATSSSLSPTSRGERLTVLGESGGLEPGEGGVGEGTDLVGGVEGAAPGGHDEDVVRGEDVDGVDTLGLELVELLEVRREVVGRAGRGERSGDGEEHDCGRDGKCQGWVVVS